MGNYKGKCFYEGDVHDGDTYRQEYLDSINCWIQSELAKSANVRECFMSAEDLKANSEHYRNAFLQMIGSPIAPYPTHIPKGKRRFVASDDLCEIYRLQIEVIPDFWFYGILSVPHHSMHAPLVIAQHGGWGTPELCCDMAGENNYGNFTKLALERGMIVFSPQLLLWQFDVETGEARKNIDIPFDRRELDGKLAQLGLSITGLEVFCIRRSIDYLAAQEFVNEQRIGMMGLSYGGYFALYTAAADTRIRSVYNAASFHNRSEICFKDWMYRNSAHTFFDAEVAGLCAPRRLLIEVGKADHVFCYQDAQEEAKRVEKYYRAYGAESQFVFNLWEGGHRFDKNGDSFSFFFDGI